MAPLNTGEKVNRYAKVTKGYVPPPQPAVLVRVDGTGVCIDGHAHAWKNRYPKSLWAFACVCLPCCIGPLYCWSHPQRECTKCGIVIQSR
ncbi:hypothetical protein DL89DRAFT_290079 [Linderina pennispora]|uniref:Uncharacterized protein n=1 Tax=Linderina pennispora TaxID=61395 RepID=A0A1Y1WLU7_9FUNG|nr:uncharacterized protein DL89DRAFT_290079 [Linderina pennispora]ORX74551.1 hypothetical protein DL89DRAFT_290079 [Linderina pennispora]